MLTAGKCASDADVASKNISTAADAFEVQRRVVFLNGITDSIILVVEGRCSLGNYDTSGRMSVTCKTAPDAFKKHYLGLSDNVTFFAEQLENIDVSVYHNRVVWKPQSLIPDIDFRGDVDELIDAVTPDNNDG
ncbi:MAG: hypothetical protein V3R87_03570 [Dehalococcoidia bacterium]